MKTFISIIIVLVLIGCKTSSSQFNENNNYYMFDEYSLTGIGKITSSDSELPPYYVNVNNMEDSIVVTVLPKKYVFNYYRKDGYWFHEDKSENKEIGLMLAHTTVSQSYIFSDSILFIDYYIEEMDTFWLGTKVELRDRYFYLFEGNIVKEKDYKSAINRVISEGTEFVKEYVGDTLKEWEVDKEKRQKCLRDAYILNEFGDFGYKYFARTGVIDKCYKRDQNKNIYLPCEAILD